MLLSQSKRPYSYTKFPDNDEDLVREFKRACDEKYMKGKRDTTVSKKLKSCVKSCVSSTTKFGDLDSR